MGNISTCCDSSKGLKQDRFANKKTQWSESVPNTDSTQCKCFFD